MSKTIVNGIGGAPKTVTRSVIGQKEPLGIPRTASMSVLMDMAELIAGLV